MDFGEKTVKQDYIFRGEVINLRVDTVTTPAGNTATRELVEHPGGVCVVPHAAKPLISLCDRVHRL